MAELLLMPRLGQSMEEGTIVQWYKREGDVVRKGESLVEVMTDKANMDVEATADGVVRKIFATADQTLPINAPIAIIGTADEPIDHLLAQRDSAMPNGLTTVDPGVNTEPIPGNLGMNAEAIPAKPFPTTQRPNDPTTQQIFSPRARHLADEHRIPIAALAGCGTGPGGRIIERDVMAYVERTNALAGQVDAAPSVMTVDALAIWSGTV